MSFPSPPDPAAFAEAVYALVAMIPRGRVMSYGQIARAIRRPTGVSARTYGGLGARWVGAAMANSPDFVPWQRVINSSGAISLRHGPGPENQRRLLEEEGIEFDRLGRVDLAQFGFVPARRSRALPPGGDIR